jgi:lipopolysaccharide transport system permease protein
MVVFYFVFAVVFQNKWRADSEAPGEFVLSLFTGLIVYNLFADIVGRAPTLVVGNVNFVKKVAFPLDILSAVSVLPALLNAVIGSLVWAGLYVLLRGAVPPAQSLAIPMLVVPIVLYALAFSWLLSALSVYVRDVGQIVPIALQTLIFASPVLFPLERVPEGMLRALLHFNPVTIPIEAIRAVCIGGAMPSLPAVAANAMVAMLLAFAGHAFFLKTQPGFADVL